MINADCVKNCCKNLILVFFFPLNKHKKNFIQAEIPHFKRFTFSSTVKNFMLHGTYLLLILRLNGARQPAARGQRAKKKAS